MSHIDRRRFLLSAAATAASLKSLAQAPVISPVTLTLHADQSGPTVPHNFIGLSYEIQQLSDPSFFHPGNAGLIAQFKALTPHGVLRLGGNTSDVGWWKATPESKQPPLPAKVVIIPLRKEERPFQELAYAVTPQAVVNLKGFLEAAGWTCLYGINLGTSTPERAAEEAKFVSRTLGKKLEYFQLGNEPDIFTNRFRVKAEWTCDKYLDEWMASVHAILAVVPHAKFGLPDTSGNPEWSARIAERLSALPDHSFVACISHHYYFSGPPSNPFVTIDHLLHPNHKVTDTAATTKAAAAKLGTIYRMTEGNSCYRGGKPGVSDVFAAALWAADYCLQLASLGYAGVNLHGGDGDMVAASLGGTLPGELLMADPKAPHARPFYTPIAHIGDQFVLEPVGYGMKFAEKFQGAKMVAVDFDPGAVNATAYAGEMGGAKGMRGGGNGFLAIINKDATQDLTVTLPADGSPYRVTHRLTAASLEAHEVKLLEASGEGKTVNVPKGSAVLLRRFSK